MGCHFLLQGIFLTPGIKPKSPAYPALAGIVFTTSATRETLNWRWKHYKAASDTTRWLRAQVLEPYCCVHILAALFASSVTRCKLIHLSGHQCSHLWNEAVNSTQVIELLWESANLVKHFARGVLNLWQPTLIAWRIPWTEKPGRLQSMWSQRVRHDWSDLACIHTWAGPDSF